MKRRVLAAALLALHLLAGPPHLVEGKKARLRANAIRHRPSESVRLMAGETTGRRPAGGSMVSVTIGSVTIGSKQVKLGASKVSGLV